MFANEFEDFNDSFVSVNRIMHLYFKGVEDILFYIY